MTTLLFSLTDRVSVILTLEPNLSYFPEGMTGRNLEEVKNALLILVKSIPLECRLQIIGYGHSTKELFPE